MKSGDSPSGSVHSTSGSRPGRTDTIRRRYDRIASMYDLMEWAAERHGFEPWRRELWSRVRGERVLEVGVGTGKNLPYYPPDTRVTAIDFSPRMLERARERAAELALDVELRLIDVQDLPFDDESFDAVVTSCVFCSVPDPVRGFEELNRVLTQDGRGYFLEHVLSRRPVVKQFMQAANPAVVRMMGANINRETRRNLEAAGFIVESERELWLDIVKLFVARKA